MARLTGKGKHMKPTKTCQHAGLLIACFAMPMSAQAAGVGLPQLDINTWPSQLFWLVVVFTAGYIVMAKFVTPRIGSVLEERRSKLEEDFLKARSASEDAHRIRAEYEATLTPPGLRLKQPSKPRMRPSSRGKRCKNCKSWLKK